MIIPGFKQMLDTLMRPSHATLGESRTLGNVEARLVERGGTRGIVIVRPEAPHQGLWLPGSEARELAEFILGVV